MRDPGETHIALAALRPADAGRHRADRGPGRPRPRRRRRRDRRRSSARSAWRWPWPAPRPAAAARSRSSAHAVYDRGLALGLVLSAVAFGVVGETRRDGAVRLHRRGRARGDLDHALQRQRLLKTSSPRSHIASLLPQETAPLRRGRFSFGAQWAAGGRPAAQHLQRGPSADTTDQTTSSSRKPQSFSAHGHPAQHEPAHQVEQQVRARVGLERRRAGSRRTRPG